MSETDLVQRVQMAWADVLAVDAVDDVPLETNFLEAGGNSLLLMLLWEQLQELTTRTVKLSDLFHHGTVRAQAALLAGDEHELTAVGARDRRNLFGRARLNEPATAGRDAATGAVD
jgi:hypothetical protein